MAPEGASRSAGQWTDEPNVQANPGGRREALRGALGERARRTARGRRWLIRQFHRLYFDEAETTWRDTAWRGVPLAKCPLDLWIYQELLHLHKPDVLVETGTYRGGSAVFFADLMALEGHGRVISIDADTSTAYPEHERVTYLSGSSTSTEVLARVRSELTDATKVMVVLDSDHRASHVRDELELYAPLVTPGCMLVVEDTNVNGHPVEPGFGPGPREAVDAFLAGNADFSHAANCEKFLMSFNDGGWLQRSSLASS